MQNRLVWGSKMLFIFVLFWVASKTAQEGPKGARDAPGSPPECLKMAQEVPKSTPGGSKRASRDPKSRSRGPKTGPRAPNSFPRRPRSFSEAPGSAAVFGQFNKFKSGRQKAPKRLQIADIDEFQRPCLKSQKEKRRAGGGDPPWGSQSAARPGGGGAGRAKPNSKCPIHKPNLQISKPHYALDTCKSQKASL